MLWIDEHLMTGSKMVKKPQKTQNFRKKWQKTLEKLPFIGTIFSLFPGGARETDQNLLIFHKIELGFQPKMSIFAINHRFIAVFGVGFDTKNDQIELGSCRI